MAKMLGERLTLNLYFSFVIEWLAKKIANSQMDLKDYRINTYGPRYVRWKLVDATTDKKPGWKS